MLQADRDRVTDRHRRRRNLQEPTFLNFANSGKCWQAFRGEIIFFRIFSVRKCAERPNQQVRELQEVEEFIAKLRLP